MNKVVLMGRLTKDPELRYTSTNNTAVCSFTLAVNRRFSRQGEEKQADFIPVVAWDKTAEFCGKYFQKGQQVAVVGRIQTRTWDDNEGKKHYVTEVVAEEAYFADSKRNDSGQAKPLVSAGAEQTDGFYPIDGEEDLPF
ncbi:MAG: single-stranded DNA-binding protein [Clostridia bacterium]|nr:single-stranded DNA-binding protein [Clostridia bacterium]